MPPSSKRSSSSGYSVSGSYLARTWQPVTPERYRAAPGSWGRRLGRPGEIAACDEGDDEPRASNRRVERPVFVVEQRLVQRRVEVRRRAKSARQMHWHGQHESLMGAQSSARVCGGRSWRVSYPLHTTKDSIEELRELLGFAHCTNGKKTCVQARAGSADRSFCCCTDVKRGQAEMWRRP